jgi:hypothetical protein
MIVRRRRLLIVNRAMTGRHRGRPEIVVVRPARGRKGKSEAGRPLGDLVERLARPIATRLDRLTARLPAGWATHLAGCSACSRRRHFLNAVLPDVGSLTAWRGLLRALHPAFRRYYARRKSPTTPTGRPLQSR